MMIRTGAISDTYGVFPAMKITDPYSPTARAKASVKPVRTAGTRGGKSAVQHRARAGGPERGRSLLELTIDLGNERLHGANRERQADKDQRDKDAQRRKCDLQAERRDEAPDPAIRGIERGEGDPGDRGRQRKGQVDCGVQKLAPGKMVTCQNPGCEE